MVSRVSRAVAAVGAALGLARAAAAASGATRLAPTNGALVNLFGVAAVPRCFPACAGEDLSAGDRSIPNERWWVERDAIVLEEMSDALDRVNVEASATRRARAAEERRLAMEHGPANDPRVRAFFANEMGAR